MDDVRSMAEQMHKQRQGPTRRLDNPHEHAGGRYFRAENDDAAPLHLRSQFPPVMQAEYFDGEIVFQQPWQDLQEMPFGTAPIQCFNDNC